jgi:hypothetical protein
MELASAFSEFKNPLYIELYPFNSSPSLSSIVGREEFSYITLYLQRPDFDR